MFPCKPGSGGGGGAAALRPSRRLLHYALLYKPGWALIVLLTLFGALFALLAPWPMKIFVDHVLGHKALPPGLARGFALLPGTDGQGELLTYVALAGVGIFAVNAALDVALTCAWIRVGQRMVYDLAGDLFARLQRRSLLFHSQNAVGDSLSRITGDSSCVYTVADALLITPGRALITLGAVIMVMARMDPGLTLLSLVIAPLLAISSRVFKQPIRAASRARRKTESRLQSHVQQTLTGIPAVQAFGQEEREHRRFQQFADDAIRAQRRRTLVRGLSELGSGLLTALGTAAILWVGSRRVLEGRLSVGDTLVFLAYLGTLQAQMKAFTGLYATLQEASASIDRVVEILSAEPEVRDLPGARALSSPVRGHVRFENVTFGYETGRPPVLRDICLEALPGQSVALVGPTGAGKSTLVSLIPRFFDPWQGRVTLDGHDLRDLTLAGLREQIALVLQEPFLFPSTVADNIAYGKPEASRGAIEAAAQAANAHAFISALPQGYDTLIGERGATLSGGERQRVAIARALLKDAPILILDEPTSALDAQTEGLLLEALERLMAGRTTLIIAHRLSTIRRADKIVVIEAGQVVEMGSHHELMEKHGLYARLNTLQFGPPPQPLCKGAA